MSFPEAAERKKAEGCTSRLPCRSRLEGHQPHAIIGSRGDVGEGNPSFGSGFVGVSRPRKKNQTKQLWFATTFASRQNPNIERPHIHLCSPRRPLTPHEPPGEAREGRQTCSRRRAGHKCRDPGQVRAARVAQRAATLHVLPGSENFCPLPSNHDPTYTPKGSDRRCVLPEKNGSDSEPGHPRETPCLLGAGPIS